MNKNFQHFYLKCEPFKWPEWKFNVYVSRGRKRVNKALFNIMLLYRYTYTNRTGEVSSRLHHLFSIYTYLPSKVER